MEYVKMAFLQKNMDTHILKCYNGGNLKWRSTTAGR